MEILSTEPGPQLVLDVFKLLDVRGKLNAKYRGWILFSLIPFLQPLDGFPDTLNLQLSHFPAQKSSMAPTASCNKYKLPCLAGKAPQEWDPAHLPSLASHWSPPGPLCSSQPIVLSAPALPFPPVNPSHTQLHSRPRFPHPVFQNITHPPKTSSHTASSRNPTTDQLPLSKLSQHADGTRLNFLHFIFLQSSLTEWKESGLWS